MSKQAFPHVAVIYGGTSAEREVSLSSGDQCAGALRSVGYTVTMIDAKAHLTQDLERARPDVVLNALHGRWGEDGCVQGLLEWLSIPYTHSGVLASALAMDKKRSKDVFRAAGLPVAADIMASRHDIEAGHVLPLPYVVKPNNEGSSVGIYLVTESANAPPRLSPDMPDMLMVEAYIKGRELTVTVMDGKPFIVTEIVTDGWYDYSAKYTAGGSHHIVPAQLPAQITDACLEYAATAHRVLGCRGISRTDFRWDHEQGLAGLFVLETNTQPGMTPTSLAPEQAAACGISFEELVTWMIKDASCDR